MKNRFFVIAAALICTAILYSGVVAQAKVKPPMKPKAVDNELLKLLPPSEAAFSLNAKRAFDESMPRLLSANQPMLNKVMSKVDAIKSQTGIDLRQFEKVVGGMSAFRATDKGFDYEPLILARGTFSSADIIAAAKTAAAGRFKEEKIGDRTVLIFTPPDVTAETKTVVKNDLLSDMIEKLMAGLNKEMAITDFDGSTVAIGSLARIREVLTSTARIDAPLQARVNRNPNAVMSFAARLPKGLDGMINLEDDILGQSLKSIREIAAAIEVRADKSDLSIIAKTTDQEQAQSLKDTLAGMQALFLPVLKNSKRADQQMYGRLLESVRMNSAGNEMTMDVSIPQADVNKLVASF